MILLKLQQRHWSEMIGWIITRNIRIYIFFYVKDAPDTFVGFDAPVLINKHDGAVTSYLELSQNNRAGWLDNIVSQGNIYERLNCEKEVSPTHQARYMLEHRLIPELLYSEGITFMRLIADEKNILNKILLETLERDGVANPYGNNAITVKPFTIKDIIIVKIIFPEPEEEPLCYEAYAFYDTMNERAGYYCLEKGGILGEQPFICGWNQDGVHMNFDNCSFDREEVFVNMLRLFLDDEDEEEQKLSAVYT